MSDVTESLSEREKETLRLLLAGHDAKSIARTLDLSVYTINDRLRETRRKLGVSSSREAARLFAQAPGEHPNFLAPKQFGVSEPENDSHQSGRTGPLWGGGHRIGWLAGGLLMVSLIVAATVLAMQGRAPATRVPGAPIAGTAVPSDDIASSASVGSARQWLVLVDNRDWATSWRDAGTMFRSQVSQESWAAAIQPVRQPLGAVLSRAFLRVTKATTLPNAPTGDYELLEFQTDFAGKRGAIETVVLAKEPSAWKVDGYFIR